MVEGKNHLSVGVRPKIYYSLRMNAEYHQRPQSKLKREIYFFLFFQNPRTSRDAHLAIQMMLQVAESENVALEESGHNVKNKKNMGEEM